MIAQMPARVFREWLLYAETNPWGEKRADWRAAMVAATMASLWRGKGQRRPKIGDFLPKFKRRRKKEKTPKDHLRAMVGLARLFGGSMSDNRPKWKKERDGDLF